MNTVPTQIYGLPAGVVIMAAVAAGERLGLPSRWAGVAAIVIGTLVGTLVLVNAGQSPLSALGQGIVFGLAIVTTHDSVVNPIKDSVPAPDAKPAATPPLPVPPAVPPNN